MDNAKDTGGPAFPITKDLQYEGMSLRDYFAAKAMQAWLINPNLCNSSVKLAGKENVKETFYVASAAYEMADAMLKARSS